MGLARNFIFTMLVFVVLVSPEWIYYVFFNPYYIAVTGAKYYISILIFSLIVGFTRQRVAIYIAAAIYCFMQASQLMHFQYYGSFYGYSEISLLFHESDDAISGFLDAWRYLLPAGSLTLIIFLLLPVVYKVSGGKRKTAKHNYVFLVLIFLVPSMQLSLSDTAAQKTQPIASHSALRNSLFAFSGVISNFHKSPTYSKLESYVAHSIKSVDANIVVVMGESLSLKHMSSYGYERETTPFLREVGAEPNVLMLPAISSAVTTRSSLALFFNQIYEPNNTKNLQSMEFSLFKLAKNSGRKTHYFTTQNNAKSLGSALSIPDIDVWVDNSDFPEVWGSYDDRLVKQLSSGVPTSDAKQFIVLHMRSAHAPYIDNYPPEFEVFETEGQDSHNYMKNSYDNSVLYVDHVLKGVYEYFSASQQPTIIVFTADHGELMGENGRYGHNQLGLDVSHVPFMLFGLNIQNDLFDALKDEFGCITNHYRISQFVSRLIGFDVKNPNEVDGQFYINGQSPYGSAGHMQYSLDESKCIAMPPS